MASLSASISQLEAIKKEQLKKNSQAFASFKSSIIACIQDPSISPLEKQQRILDEIKSSKFPRWDPSTDILSDEAIEDFQSKLWTIESLASSAPKNLSEDASSLISAITKSIAGEENRYSFAQLFFDIFDEEVALNAESTLNTDPQVLPRDAMKAQVKEFESFAFDENDTTDEEEITSFLNSLFENAEDELKEFRETIRLFSIQSLKTGSSDSPITTEHIEQAISLFYNSGLLSNAQTDILDSFLQEDEVINEILNFVKMKLASIDSFQWESPIPTSPIRQLNGRYRMIMHTDLLDGIFFTYIGKIWAKVFSTAINVFFLSSAWSRSYYSVFSKAERKFRYDTFDESVFNSLLYISPKHFAYLIQLNDPDTIGGLRLKSQASFFYSQLDPVQKGVPGYDDDESEYVDGNVNHAITKTHSQLKQEILSLAITELELSQALKKDHAMVRTDYKFFGPSISHKTINAILKFFGVSDTWLNFFQKFLKAPLEISVPGEEGSKQTRTRSRGVPISFEISRFFSEALLFTLDFHVNKVSNGAVFLYRLHDDIWFWSRSQSQCEQVWSDILLFNKTMGVQFNTEKTGSLALDVNRTPIPSTVLPQGIIKWGILHLDATGKFKIDQAAVDVHIAEMKFQLSLVPSILSWIRAYNTYMTKYLTSNFGRPVTSLGIDHVYDIISTLHRIHQELFPEQNGDVCLYLSQEITKRFSSSGSCCAAGAPAANEQEPASLPAGWFYLPIKYGGLGLVNPFSYYSGMVVSKKREAQKYTEQFGSQAQKKLGPFQPGVDKNLSVYKELKKESGSVESKFYKLHEDVAEFPSLDEYLADGRMAENVSKYWGSLYKEQFSPLHSQELHIPEDTIRKEMETLAETIAEDNADRLHKATVDYNVVGRLYGPEMVDRWGGVQPVWPQCLPLGAIELWSKQRNTWQ